MNKIDRETLKQRLAQYGLVGDEPRTRAAWLSQMGRKLLDEGKAEDARAMLADGLKIEPDSVELRVQMVRALVELKQADQASALLNQLPHDALPGWERDLLRGRVLAISSKWSEARSLVLDVLKQAPDQGEVHYFMGTIYEHDHEWEKAADEYRAAYSKGIQ